jgi:transcriptional regulator with PAS, ATPase and Fis domain
MKCPHCSAKTPKGARYCPHCGGALVGGNMEAALEGAAEAFQRADYAAVRQSLEPVLAKLKGPALGQACLYLGLSLKEQGLQTEAEARLRQSIQEEPGSPLAYGVLADLLMAQGRHAEAAASYQAAMDNVKDNSSLPALRNDLGVAYFRAGDLEKAADAFKTVLKSQPDDANALHNLGMLYLKQGLGEELRQDLREFLRAEKAEQLLLGLTRSLVAGARGQAAEPERYGIVGQSRGIRDVMDLLGRAAASDANVLLLGENGTGKELVARAVHLSGNRAGGPFVAVNCAALPETLLESELFGYEKGAFTGATGSKPGRFELAAGGTLFLDEIGDLQPSLQVKLLRAVQEKAFERLGGTRSIQSDFRLVTATHRDLRRMVLEGRFREDLFYRLFVIPIQLPPLRERQEDIELLASYFLGRQAARLGRPPQRLAPEALRRLREHSWPGNVRELENLLERAAAMHDEALLTEAMLQFDTVQDLRPSSPEEPQTMSLGPVENAEKQALLSALKQASGPAEKTAARLGMSRVTFFRKLKKYGLKYQI